MPLPLVATGYDWFHAEFELLEARAVTAEDVSAAVVNLIANLKSEKGTMATLEWPHQVNGIRDKHRRTSGSAGGRR